MLSVSADSGQLYNARLISADALPIVVGPTLFSSFNLTAITVPRNEQWQVSFIGFVIVCSDTFFSVPVRFYPRIVVTNSVSGGPFVGPTNAAAQGTPVPTSVVLNDPAGEIYVSLNLQGVVLQQGDTLSMGGWLQNDDAITSINITNITGLMRFLPMRLVSELAVANLQNNRQDQLLDVRLRSGRG